MSAVLFGLASAIAAFSSFMMFITAKTVVHEIGGMVLGLISAVFGVGCVVVYHLYELPQRIARAMTAETARMAPPVVAAALTEESGQTSAQPWTASPDGGMSLSLKIVIVLVFLIVVGGVFLFVKFYQPLGPR